MKSVLVVVDMQNDFIDGSLGTQEAQLIVPKVAEKIKEYNKYDIIYTMDSHFKTYLSTAEGRKLPIPHCIVGTHGWALSDKLNVSDYSQKAIKYSFGYTDWYDCINNREDSRLIDTIEIVGLCTDICVVSNALFLKSIFPEKKIIVDASCCAGTTPENHQKALDVMKCCQIEVINE